MNPQFAKAVDPVFLVVLEAQEQISQGKSPPPGELQNRIHERLRAADAALESRSGWELAKFALAAWIDDVLVRAAWESGAWWEDNSLEFQLFRTHDRATLFFKNAVEAKRLNRPDALEVFYLCVVLGFRGFYATEESKMLATHLDLPPTIQDWVHTTSHAIRLRDKPGLAEKTRPASYAPPLKGVERAVWSAVVFVFLLASTAAAVWYLLLDRAAA